MDDCLRLLFAVGGLVGGIRLSVSVTIMDSEDMARMCPRTSVVDGMLPNEALLGLIRMRVVAALDETGEVGGEGSDESTVIVKAKQVAVVTDQARCVK